VLEQDAAARHPALGHSRKYTFVAFKPLEAEPLIVWTGNKLSVMNATICYRQPA